MVAPGCVELSADESTAGAGVEALYFKGLCDQPVVDGKLYSRVVESWELERGKRGWDLEVGRRCSCSMSGCRNHIFGIEVGNVGSGDWGSCDGRYLE